jgi:UDP-glucose 4-epimerase
MECTNLKYLSTLKGQNVLVTGASGFIGSTLCNALRKQGAIVHGVSRYDQKNKQTCDYWWKSDLSDSQEVNRLLKSIRPELIIHLASKVSGVRSISLVQSTFKDGVIATLNLLISASELGCRRIILTGSLEEPNLEDGYFIPSSPYAAAKFTATTYGRMFYRLYKTPVVILKLFMVYGPNQKDMNKLVPYVTSSLLKNKSPLLSDGRRLVDWIYVDDVVNAYMAAATVPQIEGKTFDIGSGKLTSIRDVVNHIVHLIKPTSQPYFNSVPERPFEQEPVANIKKTKLVLRWRPVINLSEGLSQTIAWYRKLSLVMLHSSLCCSEYCCDLFAV